MNDDLIKRSDAIAEIYKVRTPDVASHHYAELFINAVCRAPSANRQQEWIPCEERLPEKGSRVIACDDEGGIDVMWYEKSFDKDICVWKDDYSIEWDGVVAWMPLPMPYMKGADE